jgi:hypothetical protein
MAFDRGRRDFLGRDLLAGLAKILDASRIPVEEERPRDYFATFESCQPLLADAGDSIQEPPASDRDRGRAREDIAGRSSPGWKCKGSETEPGGQQLHERMTNGKRRFFDGREGTVALR